MLGRRAQKRSRRWLQRKREKGGIAASADVATEQGWRIGYVNTNGLNEENWRRFAGWMEEGRFDLLFLAETWYVNYARYSSWKGTLAATPLPEGRRAGRYGGGFTVLSSLRARKRGAVVQLVSEALITVDLEGIRVSAVYLPPKMAHKDVEVVLGDCRTSSVVLGDFNTRFPTGRGNSRPRERVQVFTEWMQQLDFIRLRPETVGSPFSRTRLTSVPTVDHCFMRQTQWEQRRLHLMRCDSLGVETDHLYLLCLSLGKAEGPAKRMDQPPRYWIGKLAQPAMRKLLERVWSAAAPRVEEHLHDEMSVDELNERLVQLCQRVCEDAVGRVDGRPKRVDASAGDRDLGHLVRDQSAMGTHKLVRQVMAEDEHNGPLLPAEEGGNAVEEMAAILHLRYGGETREIRTSKATMDGDEVSGDPN